MGKLGLVWERFSLFTQKKTSCKFPTQKKCANRPNVSRLLFLRNQSRPSANHGNEIKHSEPNLWSGHTHPESRRAHASLIPIKMGDSAKPIVVINRRHLPIYLGESEIQVCTERGHIRSQNYTKGLSVCQTQAW